MFDLVFLEFWPLNLRVTWKKNQRPLSVSFNVDSAALSTSVQNVVPRAREHVASTWSRHFEQKSIAQRCRRHKIRVEAVDYFWKLHANSTVITREKRGQTFRDRTAISQDVASMTFCVRDIFRLRAFLFSNLCSALNCQSTAENRTEISQFTTEILQRKHAPILRN